MTTTMTDEERRRLEAEMGSPDPGFEAWVGGEANTASPSGPTDTTGGSVPGTIDPVTGTTENPTPQTTPPESPDTLNTQTVYDPSTGGQTLHPSYYEIHDDPDVDQLSEGERNDPASVARWNQARSGLAVFQGLTPEAQAKLKAAYPHAKDRELGMMVHGGSFTADGERRTDAELGVTGATGSPDGAFVNPWAGDGSGGGSWAPPPPPPPPAAPPPPADFRALTQMSAMGDLPQFERPDTPEGFQRPDDPGAAPDFQAIAAALSDYTRPDAPGEAPDFRAIAEGIGAYETPDGAFMGEGMYDDMESFARDYLGAYNPFGQGAGAAGLAELSARMDQRRGADAIAIDDWIAERGLVGSSYEGDARIGAAESARRDELLEAFELQKLMADYEMRGRESAGNLGLQTGEFGRGLGADRRQDAQYKQDDSLRRGALELEAAGQQEDSTMDRARFDSEVEKIAQELALQKGSLEITAADLAEAAEMARSRFGLDVEETAATDSLNRGRLALDTETAATDSDFRNTQLQMQDSLNRAELALQAGLAGDAAQMDRARLELDTMRAMDEATLSRSELELQKQQIDLRAWEIMEDSRLRGRAMDIDEARIQAELQIRRDQMGQDASQFDRSLNQQGHQFDQAMWRDLLRWMDDTETDFSDLPPGMLEAMGLDPNDVPDVPDVQASDPDEEAPQADRYYQTKPTEPPEGSTKKDGYWEVTPQGYRWKVDRQDWWNPFDWGDNA